MKPLALVVPSLLLVLASSPVCGEGKTQRTAPAPAAPAPAPAPPSPADQRDEELAQCLDLRRAQGRCQGADADDQCLDFCLLLIRSREWLYTWDGGGL